ncbi:hypothetical protein KP509_18G038700 [Ceratopteris richardii]|nr:hypothetical protein KP509_18G038700 [Ceratopteris richardii]
MLQDGVQPNRFTYIILLKVCGRVAALDEGRRIHTAMRRDGLVSSVFAGSSLVSMYGKCGSIDEAEGVFIKLPERNVVTWNALLSAYVEQNAEEKALMLYRQMCEEKVCPYERTYVIALQACGRFAEREEASHLGGNSTKVIALDIGRAFHVDAVRDGVKLEGYFGSVLLGMYGKCGSFNEAGNVFSELPQHDVVFSNVLLSTYVQHNSAKEALLLYKHMLEAGTIPDELTFVAVLQACGIFAENEVTSVYNGIALKSISIEIVKAIKMDIWKMGCSFDMFLGSALISCYGKCGHIFEAECVFQGLPKRDIAAWNSMLSAYIEAGHEEKALRLYRQILEECIGQGQRTVAIVLQACCILVEKENFSARERQFAKEMALSISQAIHAGAKRNGFHSDMFVCNSLVTIYSKSGELALAEGVFFQLPRHDMVLWCALLTGYVEQGEAEKGLLLFKQMLVEGGSPEKLHFVVAFQACGYLAEKEQAVLIEEYPLKLIALRLIQAIHADAEVKNLVSDAMVGSTLLCSYGKCGAIREAQCTFEELVHRDIVAWNAMLSAYLEHGAYEQVLSLFSQLLEYDVTFDSVTLLCSLKACSETENVEVCTQLHHIIVSSMGDANLLLNNSLIDAYGCCIRTEDLKASFDCLCEHDVVSWTACISGHARRGDFALTLQMFEEMLSTGIKPDEIAFLSLVSACSHAGLVLEGVNYFNSMTIDHVIAPNPKHFASAVDLLGRAGNFIMLKALITKMPFKTDMNIWLSLLAVCRTHGNSELGKHAFDCAVQLQPLESTIYVLMSNMYADSVLQYS